MMVVEEGGGPCCNDDWCWQWHGKSRLQWPQPNDWWNRHIFRQSIHNQHFLCLVLGDFSMPMCTAIGWPVPCLQRVLFAVDRVLQVLFALVCRIAMPKRIKSALKLQSETESRHVFTHLQCHDSLVLTFRDASCLDSSLRLITLVCIRRWSYWEAFYRSEYCDSQLFLTVTSHVKEAYFNRRSHFS